MRSAEEREAAGFAKCGRKFTRAQLSTSRQILHLRHSPTRACSTMRSAEKREAAEFAQWARSFTRALLAQPGVRALCDAQRRGARGRWVRKVRAYIYVRAQFPTIRQ
eukprot:7461319-Pyramimonas_sp.AAC.1